MALEAANLQLKRRTRVSIQFEGAIVAGVASSYTNDDDRLAFLQPAQNSHVRSDITTIVMTITSQF
jgi:hypothetical protein